MVIIISLLIWITCGALLITTLMSFSDIDKTMLDIKKETILDGYKKEIKAEIQTCMSIIDTYYAESLKGTMNKKYTQN